MILATFVLEDILYNNGLGGFTNVAPTIDHQELAFVSLVNPTQGAFFFNATAPIPVYTSLGIYAVKPITVNTVGLKLVG